MVKFVKVAKKKTMLTLSIDGKDKWVTCTPQVLTYAKNTFKGGEEVDIQSAEEPGELGLHVIRISKAGQGGSPQPQASAQKVAEFVCEVCGKELKDGTYKKCYTCNQKKSATSTKPTCSDCGKELKDDKYKKCYECNKRNPAPKKSGGSYGKSPEVQESIKRQAIGHMTSRTLIALTGQVDVNSVGAVAEAIYKKYQELVG